MGFVCGAKPAGETKDSLCFYTSPITMLQYLNTYHIFCSMFKNQNLRSVENTAILPPQCSLSSCWTQWSDGDNWIYSIIQPDICHICIVRASIDQIKNSNDFGAQYLPFWRKRHLMWPVPSISNYLLISTFPNYLSPCLPWQGLRGPRSNNQAPKVDLNNPHA